jgi:hypothetical protein
MSRSKSRQIAAPGWMGPTCLELAFDPSQDKGNRVDYGLIYAEELEEDGSLTWKSLPCDRRVVMTNSTIVERGRSAWN